MFPFLDELIAHSPRDNIIEQLKHTAYDELMILVPAAGEYISVYHSDGKYFSPALDGTYRQLLDYASSHMVHPDDRKAHLAMMDLNTMQSRLAKAKPRGILSGTVRYLWLDGNWHEMLHLLIGGADFGIPEDQVYFFLYDIQDIKEREEGQHINAAANNERLRGMMPDLLTENTFFALAQQHMHHMEGQWCMLAVDVKHFKLFKELNGQRKGDLLLVRFAEHIHDLAEFTGGLACYRGQDDFGLLVPFEQALIDKLFNTLRQEIDSLSGTSGFFPLFGICMIYDPDVSALEYFNHAALTAEEIKDDLQYHVRIYDPDTHERHVEEFKLLSDFKDAIGLDEITFHVQPQVNVDNGRIVGGESLARWQKKDGTIISPTVFVPVLEKYGVITDLDSYVWERVCVWLRKMIDEGIQPVPVSVNVSRINIFAVDVPERLNQLAERYDLDHSLIEVEITESAYIEDDTRIQDAISSLRENGFRVLMDDFGSGYSSLNMLRSINVDTIKLDAQFLRFNIGEEQKGINILESIISMTKSLSTPIIVEGVETPTLVRYLKDMGCKYMQGFHYYRPMPPDEFEALISIPGNVDRKGIVQQRNKQLHVREFLEDSIYSDAMLNNILGPVAFYGRNGENVDIVRFNNQFVRMIGLDAGTLEERRYHIQDFFVEEDRPKFFVMLDEAYKDRINGAKGLFRVYNPDGSVFWIRVLVYYLKDENGQQIYYCSAMDMTEVMTLRDQLKHL